MFNWDIIGHKKMLDVLENCVIRHNIVNAYLFHGHSKIGKTKVANQFIKALFCVNDDKICLSCKSCLSIENGSHPDVFRVKKEEGKNNISIEQVREMQNRLLSGSFLNSYKIGIIEDAEYLNESGWNSLLKISEEPPSKTVIIIIAEAIENIPATIISRCQNLKFSYVLEDEIYKYLRFKNIERSRALELARFSRGRVGLVKEILENSLWDKEYNEKIENLFSLFSKEKTIKEKNDFVAAISKDKTQSYDFLNFFSVFARDLILSKIDNSLTVNLRYKDKISEIADYFSFKRLESLIEDSIKFKEALLGNANAKILLENLILDIY